MALRKLSGAWLVALLCFAEVLAMVGNGTFPALIPVFRADWALSNTEAGWISGVYYAGYVLAVPILVGLTDREDPRAIYLVSILVSSLASLGFALLARDFWGGMIFRFLGGAAFAGTYMVGAKILADRIEGAAQTRALAFYTAHFSIGTSLSVLIAGEMHALGGWELAYGAAAIASAFVLPLVWVFVEPGRKHAAPREIKVFDFRSVITNRPAFGYILGYTAHIWELAGFRTWLVAFLTFGFARAGTDGYWGMSATQLGTVMLMLGLPASVLGNELALRFGRRRLVIAVMLVSAAVSCVVGFAASLPLAWLIALLLFYGCTVTADSASLTAGAVAAAAADRRGAAMAMHQVFGFSAGIVAPLVFGAALDLAGGEGEVLAWGAAFALMGLGVALGPLFLMRLAAAR